jgi:hypothetical protein
MTIDTTSAEGRRLAEDRHRASNWKRWGPYLSERQWGTVREDYSPHGNCWEYFPHDHARSRAYRWGEDGILGITDRQCRLCFAVALWNGRDPILKERLFGLTGPEGNHGEDVKECYYYLSSTPTHSWLQGLYKYPQSEFPYARLVDENRWRSRLDSELELADTGAFEEHRYFDIFVEYAKSAPEDILIRITAVNRGPEAAPLHLLPTLWFRNTWSWGCTHEGCEIKPRIERRADLTGFNTSHASLGRYRFTVSTASEGSAPRFLLTENESNSERLYGVKNGTHPVKDAFHEYILHGRYPELTTIRYGTKAAAHYELEVPAGGQIVVELRLVSEKEAEARSTPDFAATFDLRRREAEEFYESILPASLSPEERRVAEQAYAGLLWSKQFYHYVVQHWIQGDPAHPAPPKERKHGRNNDWSHLFNRDVISMPDKWEYPWYAAWDLAFHMLPFAKVDPDFAKSQLVLFLREWYMHPNGQIPAYEFAFSDVNPPVHAWACWRVYKMTGERGERDRLFLARVFKKLLLNFTWWVNRKDLEGKHLFSGGFLGLDNIGVFDRSQPLPTGGHLEQADGTAWMAFYASTMLSMALELARHEPSYEDIASKFFEHFIAIADAMNTLGGSGLWDETDGFYYDHLHVHGSTSPLRLRSLVGIVPLFAVEVLEEEHLETLPGFRRRMEWFISNRRDLSQHISHMEKRDMDGESRFRRLLAIPSKERLVRVLRYVLDETEFLSPFGVRSISKVHKDQPYVLRADSQEYRVDYTPGESTTGVFGGNSNWRGPIWFPLNFLLIEALERYHHFHGPELRVECPTGSGRYLTLDAVARELASRLATLFLPNEEGRRPCHGHDPRYRDDPHWKDLVLFHEYFHGDEGKGLGASHQTGWTSLVTKLIEDLARAR